MNPPKCKRLYVRKRMEMVGAVRFELTTSCTRNKRATRLRYAPNQGLSKLPAAASESNDEFSGIAAARSSAALCALHPARGVVESGP